MDISKIVEIERGSLTREDFIPIKDVLNENIEVGLNFSREQIEEAIRFLNINLEDVFFNKKALFREFIVYFKNNVFVDLMDLNINSLKAFRVKEKINLLPTPIQKYISKNEYENAFGIMESKIRALRFVEMFEEIPDNQKFEVFSYIYTQEDYASKVFSSDFMRKVLTFNTELFKKKDFEIDEEGYIRIYRGMTTKSTEINKTFSWTTNYNVAIKFANKFDSFKCIYSGKVKLENIKGYFTRRNEFEVIVLPEDVLDIKKIK